MSEKSYIPDTTASLLAAQRHLTQALLDLDTIKRQDYGPPALWTAYAQVHAAMKLLVDMFARCDFCGDSWLKSEFAMVGFKIACQGCYQTAKMEEDGPSDQDQENSVESFWNGMESYIRSNREGGRP